MRFPIRSSAQDKICRAFHKHGAMTYGEAIKIHGNLYNYANQMRHCYEACVERGYLMEENGVYSLPYSVKKHYDDIAPVKAAPVVVVAAPIRNVFGKELQAKHVPTVFGMREGSNDFRNWPSKYA